MVVLRRRCRLLWCWEGRGRVVWIMGNYQWKRIIDVVSSRIRDITAAQSSYFSKVQACFIRLWKSLLAEPQSKLGTRVVSSRSGKRANPLL